jgi:hypothetical protein
MNEKHDFLPPASDELWELTAAMCDDRATPEQRDRLEVLLHDDKDAKSFFVAYMQLHAALAWRWQGHADRVAYPPGLTSPDAQTDEAAGTRSPILGFLGDTMRQGWGFLSDAPRSPLIVIAVLAASLFTLLGIWAAPGFLATAGDRPIVSGVHVARITGTIDCCWTDEKEELRLGADLRPGQVLDLAEGFAEVSLQSGAWVILEGPAVFELQSGKRACLQSGKLTVLVPNDVPDFTIQTPKFTIVKLGTDWGTEYGVVVGAQGEGNLEVFVGSTELRVDAPSGGGHQQRVEAGLDVRISSSGQTTVLETGPGGKQFVREMTAPIPPQQISGLRMWLKADAGVFRDANGTAAAVHGDPVGCWIDQSGNGFSPRQEMPDRRPWLAADSRGNPVLRFGGENQYLHEPSGSGPTCRVLDHSDAGTKPQFTVFFVFSSTTAMESWRQSLFGQFVDTDGRTSRYFHITQEGKFSYDEWWPWYHWLRSPAGVVVSGRTHVAMVVRDDNRRSMYVDGVLVADDSVAEDYAGPEPYRWWIGARPLNGAMDDSLHGDIAEILIYNRTLDQIEQLSVKRYLRDKHVSP